MRGLALGLCSRTVSRLSVYSQSCRRCYLQGTRPVCGRWRARTTDLSRTACSPQATFSKACQLQGFESLIFKMPFKICNLEINCTQMPGLGHAFVEGKDKRQMLRWGFCDRPASDSGRHHVQVFVSQLPWGFQSNNRTFPLGDLQCVLGAEQPLADSCSLVWEGNPHLPPGSHRSRGPARRPWLQKSCPASWVGQVEM